MLPAAKLSRLQHLARILHTRSIDESPIEGNGYKGPRRCACCCGPCNSDFCSECLDLMHTACRCLAEAGEPYAVGRETVMLAGVEGVSCSG